MNTTLSPFFTVAADREPVSTIFVLWLSPPPPPPATVNCTTSLPSFDNVTTLPSSVWSTSASQVWFWSWLMAAATTEFRTGFVLVVSNVSSTSGRFILMSTLPSAPFCTSVPFSFTPSTTLRSTLPFWSGVTGVPFTLSPSRLPPPSSISRSMLPFASGCTGVPPFTLTVFTFPPSSDGTKLPWGFTFITFPALATPCSMSTFFAMSLSCSALVYTSLALALDARAVLVADTKAS